ncbi:hypothetical protein ACIBAI_23030 [Streptomyces sp. NPDC051041]|uniref:hypothetical protein n=1 Tax=Streptomyces sp. NPDC051041 TaxID=3365640 RepID=UPI0037BAE6E8
MLASAAYTGLSPGVPAGEVARALPDRAVADPPTGRAPAPPEDAGCRSYRAGGELLASVDHFRFCFDRGRLVAKGAIPRVGPTGEGHEEHEEFAQ